MTDMLVTHERLTRVPFFGLVTCRRTKGRQKLDRESIKQTDTND